MIVLIKTTKIIDKNICKSLEQPSGPKVSTFRGVKHKQHNCVGGDSRQSNTNNTIVLGVTQWVTIIMANLKFPRIRMFWQSATRIDYVANNFKINRYFKIRKNVHISAAESREPGSTNIFLENPTFN